MAITDAIINYRRFLKRRNCSRCTLRNYMNTLKHFVIWLAEPIEEVSARSVLAFIDHLLDRRLSPKTINCYLDGIRGFYDYLIHEENVPIVNPVKRGYVLKLSRPLPRYLRDEEIPRLFAVIDRHRDRTIFMLMLRCGLRVEEVAQLTLSALDLPRSQLFVYHGKGAKDRVVYLSHDAQQALVEYLDSEPSHGSNVCSWWTAEYPIRHDHRLRTVFADKSHDLFVGFRVQAYILYLVGPSCEKRYSASLFENDPDSNFTCLSIVGAIVGDRRDRITLEASLGLLFQFVSEPSSLERHSKVLFGYPFAFRYHRFAVSVIRRME